MYLKAMFLTIIAVAGVIGGSVRAQSLDVKEIKVSDTCYADFKVSPSGDGWDFKIYLRDYDTRSQLYYYRNIVSSASYWRLNGYLNEYYLGAGHNSNNGVRDHADWKKWFVDHWGSTCGLAAGDVALKPVEWSTARYADVLDPAILSGGLHWRIGEAVLVVNNNGGVISTADLDPVSDAAWPAPSVRHDFSIIIDGDVGAGTETFDITLTADLYDNAGRGWLTERIALQDMLSIVDENGVEQEFSLSFKNQAGGAPGKYAVTLVAPASAAIKSVSVKSAESYVDYFGEPIGAAAENAAPEISSITLVNTGVDKYNIGSKIQFRATLSGDVSFKAGDTVALPFTIGGKSKTATYTASADSEITELIFEYEVLAGDGGAVALDTSVGITLGESNSQSDLLSGIADNADVTVFDGAQVDGVVPTINRVAVDPKAYKLNEEITFKLTMSEGVKITGPTDGITLPFLIEGQAFTATYTGVYTDGGATTTEGAGDARVLEFAYVVDKSTPAGDVSLPDATAVITLPTGTSILDAAGNVLVDSSSVDQITDVSVDTSSTSGDEDVVDGSVTITVVEQPIAGASGAVFPQQPVVQVLDNEDNPVPSGSTVSVSLDGDVSQDKLTGTKTIDVQDDGFARFSDLSISGAEAGNEFQLVFTSSIGGVAAIVSEVVTVAGPVSVPTDPNELGTKLEGPVGGAAVASRGSAPVTLTLRDAAGRRTGTNEGVAAVTFLIVDGPADAYLKINPSGTSVTVPSSNSASGEFTVDVVSNSPGTVSLAAAVELSSGETKPLPGTLDVAFSSVAETNRRFEIVRQPVAAGDGEKLAVQPVLHVLNADGSLDTTDDTTVIRVDPVALTAGVSGSLNKSPSGATAKAQGGVVTFDDLILDGDLGEGYELSFRDETPDRAAIDKADTIKSDAIYLTGVLEVIREELSSLLYEDLRKTVEEQQDRFGGISSGALARLHAKKDVQDEDIFCGDVKAQDVGGSAKTDAQGFFGSGTWGGHTYDCTSDTHIINSGELELGFTPEDRLTFDFNVTRQQERFVEEDRLLGMFWGGYGKRDALGSSTASGTIDGVGLNGGVYGALQLEEKAYLDFYAAGAVGYHRFDLTFERDGMKEIAADGNYQYGALFGGAALSGKFEFDGFNLRPRSGVEVAYARSSDANVDVLGGIETGQVDIPAYHGLRLYVTPSFEFTHSLQGQGLDDVVLNTVVSPSLSCRRYSRHGPADCDPSLRFEFNRHDTQSQAQLGLDMEYVFDDQKDSWDIKLDFAKPMFDDTTELSFGVGRSSSGTSSLNFSLGASF